VPGVRRQPAQGLLRRRHRVQGLRLLPHRFALEFVLVHGRSGAEGVDVHLGLLLVVVLRLGQLIVVVLRLGQLIVVDVLVLDLFDLVNAGRELDLLI
jgi:hypothetical protein